MKKILLTLGAGLLMAAMLMGMLIVAPLKNEKRITFESSYKGRQVMLCGGYFEVPNAEYGVVLCPGYSCDRQKMNATAALFVKNGFSVFSFDYAGQGESGGTIGFDNAKTDAIAQEIADAMDAFHELSGISYEKTVLFGHSMGGRSILRLLYDCSNPEAVTNIVKRPVGYAILSSPDVNYHFNAQASLFSGASDAVEEPWASYSASNAAGTQIFLYGSTGDDIVTHRDIWEIYRHLGGTSGQREGVGKDWCINDTGSKVTVEVVPGVLHSFQFYSADFARMLNEACSDISGKPAAYPAGAFYGIYLSWICACIGALLITKTLSYGQDGGNAETVPVIYNMRRFLRAKALLWIPGVIFAFGVCCICVVSPWGSPIMNVPYMCFIAGYGIVMLLCYRRGRFPGASGKLPRPHFRFGCAQGKAIVPITVVALLTFAGWFTLRCTVFRLFPFNFRLVWWLFAGLLMTIGYYVSGVEEDMLTNAGASGAVRLLYATINYIPLLLFAGFYLVIRSYSGLVQQLINLALMYILFIPMGEYLKKALRNSLAGAMLSAFLFQGMMLTSASLIALF